MKPIFPALMWGGVTGQFVFLSWQTPNVMLFWATGVIAVFCLSLLRKVEK